MSFKHLRTTVIHSKEATDTIFRNLYEILKNGGNNFFIDETDLIWQMPAHNPARFPDRPVEVA